MVAVEKSSDMVIFQARLLACQFGLKDLLMTPNLNMHYHCKSPDTTPNTHTHTHTHAYTQVQAHIGIDALTHVHTVVHVCVHTDMHTWEKYVTVT